MTGKKYSGAPFGIQTSRFDVSGVHPDSKKIGTFTEAPYCRIVTSKENTLRGPGIYTIQTGDFIPSAVAARAQGPNWERAYDTAKFNSIPHMLYRDKWEHKKELVEFMGPGKYNSKDFVCVSNQKPSSSRGVCQTGEPRFPKENAFMSNLPGPGTYGKGGVPWAAMEAKAMESTSTVGTMESPGRDYYQMRSVGSGLAPCRYGFPSSIEEMLSKKVSARGPYDLFSGERHSMPRHVLEKKHMGPGKYDLNTSTNDWSDEHHIKHGEFSARTQYPEQPTERIYCHTLGQCPRPEKDPGPGYYYRRRTHSAPTSQHPFNSSALRFDRRARTFFYGNTNPVGTGQYDVTRWNNSQHTNGSTSVFSSNTPRLPPRVDTPRELMLNERLHPKKISNTRKLFEAEVLEAPC